MTVDDHRPPVSSSESGEGAPIATAEGGEDLGEVSVAADGYRIVLRPTAADLGEQPAQTWRAVLTQVNQHLMRVATAPTRLLMELLEGVTRLVRGVTRVPGSVADRLEQAHSQADSREQAEQRRRLARLERSEAGAGMGQLAVRPADGELDPAVDPRPALESVVQILKAVRARGTDAYLVIGPNGVPIVVIGLPPDSDSIVAEAVVQLLPSGADRTGEKD